MNIPGALRDWAEFMRGNAEHCDQLANALEREIADGAKIKLDFMVTKRCCSD